jgi:uncharacterized protein YciI
MPLNRFSISAKVLEAHSEEAMLIVNAPNEQELRRRLEADPWMRAGVLRTIDIYAWEILLGKLP